MVYGPAFSSSLHRVAFSKIPSMVAEQERLMRQKREQSNPDEEMRRTADDLIQVAIQAFMKMHDVDRKTAQQWITSAVVTAARRKTPESR